MLLLSFLSKKTMPYLGSEYTENDIEKTLYKYSDKFLATLYLELDNRLYQ